MSKILSHMDLLIANSPAVKPLDQTVSPRRDEAKLAFAFLWLFTFWVFGRPEDIFPAVALLRPTFVFGACAGLAYLGAVLMGRARLRWSRELILVLLLTAWFTLGIPFAFWRTGSLTVLTDVWFKTVVSFFLLTQTLTTVGRVRKLLWAIICSELLATSASIVLQGNEALRIGDRLAGVSQGMFGWNFLGVAFSVTLPYVAALYVSRRSLPRTSLLMAVVGSTMWMLVLTASRGGFLNVVFSIILTWWFVLRGSARGRIVGVIIAVCLVVALAKAPDVFWFRLQTIWGDAHASANQDAESAAESTEGRKTVIRRAIIYTVRYPIFGVGIGCFPIINGTELHDANAWYGTHNTFMQIAAEAGIPALVLFLLLMLTMFRHARNVANKFVDDPLNAELHLLARSTLVSVAAFAFGGLFVHIAYEYFLYYLAGISAGLWTIVREETEEPLCRPGLPRSIAAIPSYR